MVSYSVLEPFVVDVVKFTIRFYLNTSGRMVI